MRQLKSLLTQLLLITSLLLPWTVTEAAEYFENAGHINSISFDTFTMQGKKYRLASDAKLSSESSSRRSFRDFKKGDFIYFKGNILNGVHYVDIIFYETPEPS